MSINCYFGDYSTHENETKMLNSFLSQLQADWGNSTKWVYVIYNAIWDGQEIDLVCFTQNSIIVCDFKNYVGSLTGKENGQWNIVNTNGESIIVKGGNQLNPFVQIRKNKYFLLEWLVSRDFFSNDNLGYISGAIVFREISQLNLELSSNVKKWMHVTDLAHSNSFLNSISSSEIQLNEDEVLKIIDTLSTTKYEWQPHPVKEPSYSPFETIPSNYNKLDDLRFESKIDSYFIDENLSKPSYTKHVVLPLVVMLLLSFAIAGVLQSGFLATVVIWLLL